MMILLLLIAESLYRRHVIIILMIIYIMPQTFANPHTQKIYRGDSIQQQRVEGRKGNYHMHLSEMQPEKCRIELFFWNGSDLVARVIFRENMRNICPKIIYKSSLKNQKRNSNRKKQKKGKPKKKYDPKLIKRKLIQILFIIFIICLCYKAGLITAIESTVGNLIAALIIFLLRGSNS